MRTQFANKPLFYVLVVGAFCAASIALGVGANALSKGRAHPPAAEIAKASVTGAKPAHPIAPDRKAPSEETSAAPDSWKRWPSLTDF